MKKVIFLILMTSLFSLLSAQNGRPDRSSMDRAQFERPELTEEQAADIEAIKEKMTAKRAKMKAGRPELTEEQIAEMEARKAEMMELKDNIKARIKEHRAHVEETEEVEVAEVE